MLMGISPKIKPQRLFADPSRCNDSKGETMSTKIFVNLPVKNLNQSIEFFTQLGFQFNPQFTDETATWMIVSNGSQGSHR